MKAPSPSWSTWALCASASWPIHLHTPRLACFEPPPPGRSGPFHFMCFAPEGALGGNGEGKRRLKGCGLKLAPSYTVNKRMHDVVIFTLVILQALS